MGPVSERRTGQRASGPGGPRRPGQRGIGRGGPRPSGGAGEASAERRPRFTGRAAVLLLVVAVLAVSYASSLRAYIQQRSHIGDLKGQIAERRASIDELEREKDRWEDPEFVRQQARERFGYLKPGETSYVVLDGNGDPIESEAGRAELTDPDTVAEEPPDVLYSDLWESVKLAGDPPDQEPPPLTQIGGSKRSSGR